MNRRFWLIEYTWWSPGPDGTEITTKALFWGTWMEAARYCVKQDQSIGRPKQRNVKPFDMPDVTRKRKGGLVF